MDAPVFLDHADHLRERRWLRRLAMSLVRDHSLADDLVQDVFVQVLRCGALPDETHKRLAYLAKAARHLAGAIVKKRRVDAWRNEQLGDRSAQPTPAEVVEHAETERRFLDAVLHLTPPMREAVLLRYREGLSTREVADRLALPVERIYKVLAEARATLRGDLERKGLGPEWAIVLLRWSASQSPVRASALSDAMAVLGACVLAAAVGLSALLARGSRSGDKPGGGDPLVQGAATQSEPVRMRDSRREPSIVSSERSSIAAHSEFSAPAAPMETPNANGGPIVLWKTVGLSFQDQGPRGLAVGDNHELYQVDYDENVIRVLDPTGQQRGITKRLKSEIRFSKLALSRDHLFASSPGFGLLAFDPHTMEEEGRAQVNDPGGHWLINGLCADTNNNVHLLSSAEHTVHVFDPELRPAGTWECDPHAKLLCSSPSGYLLVASLESGPTTIHMYTVTEHPDRPSHLPVVAEIDKPIVDMCIAGSRIYFATEEQGVFVYNLPNNLDASASWMLVDCVPPGIGVEQPGHRSLVNIAVDVSLGRIYLAYREPERVVVAVAIRSPSTTLSEPAPQPAHLIIRDCRERELELHRSR